MAEENKETDCKGCLRYAKALIQLRYGIIPKKQCIRMKLGSLISVHGCPDKIY